MEIEKLTTLVSHIAPNDTIQIIEALSLGFTNQSFRVSVNRPDSTEDVFIVKIYSDDYDDVFEHNDSLRATLEHKLLTCLQSSGIPCPEPVFADLQGAILGSPVLVTKQIPGKQILAHPSNPLWAEKAATVAVILARIHMCPCPDTLIANLPNALMQATWFLKNDSIPDYMQAYPDGVSIWNIIHQELPKIKQTDPVIVHGDFWSGNILWDKSQVSGILDWEDVSFGEAGLDIAYCRMEMILDGMDDAADTFLNTYETIMGKPVLNLGLCELAVAVPPMRRHVPYLTISPIQERFRQFVANAKKRIYPHQTLT